MLSLIADGVTDAVLVERARQDDQAAFAALYQRHARYLAGVVYRLMGDDTDLDDIIQETFLLASDALPRLLQPERVRPWLVTIAVRRARRHLARRRRRGFLLSVWAELGAPASDPGERGAVDDLYRALDRLPNELRVPWVLHRIEQLTLADAAEACAVSLATIKRRVAEAERRLHGRARP